MKVTGHVVSHTHWDREWYLPFQQFRLKLVDLIDDLLDILAKDPNHRYFMLDGQAIVLEDYLEIRPEREEELRRHIQSGRLLIGPWYILPDEFLVSGEATIRNLLLGRQVCQALGPVMDVGYVPDPFGHISQLPQILAGFGLDTAVFRRGLDDEPALLRWSSPDGTTVFVVYLRDGYGNAAWLPDDPEEFSRAIRERVESLAPHTGAPHVLLMNGTDHMPAMRELPALMAHANRHLDDIQLIHSTLPQYIEEARKLNQESPTTDLPVVHGELRSPKRHHLLPGVLSTRTWIKQHNHAVETLLESWAEPFSTWAWLVGGRDQSAQVWQAWNYLIKNHPHDSICGCSVDQVHREMVTRFDWAEQIGETVTKDSLHVLAGQIDTADLDTSAPIVVFNPTAGPRTDVVTLDMPLPAGRGPWTMVDAAGEPVPTQMTEAPGTIIVELNLNRYSLRAMLPMVRDGQLRGWALHDLDVQTEGDTALVDIKVAQHGTPAADQLDAAWQKVRDLLDRGFSRFNIRVHTGAVAEVQFVAEEIPGHGYRTFALAKGETRASEFANQAAQPKLENEFFAVEVDASDGTLTVFDKQTGVEYPDLNRFVDGGDAGDEYNYCPPADDALVDGPVQAPQITYEKEPARQSVRIDLVYRLPASLSEDRAARSEATVEVPITTIVSVSPGVPRIDVQTTVDNRAKDHRLRVHFPTPIETDHSTAAGHFDVIDRPIDLPQGTADWVEQPVTTYPQRGFVDLSDGQIGLMVTNRGLPEYEVLRADSGSTIALTLLRCVGWLSRDDFPCREGHAGPFLATPEAQCLDGYTFEYGLIPHAGDWQTVFAEAHAFNAPLRAITTASHPGPLPVAGSLIDVEPGNFVITALKKAEAGDGMIVRGYNIAPDAIDATVRFNQPIQSVTRVNLAEDPIETLTLDENGRVRVPVQSREIVTLKFRLRE